MRVPYPEKTMQSEEARYPAPSGRFFLLLLLSGGVVGLVLLLLRAPFWAFYVAPIAMTPLVVWGLRSLDSNKHSKPRVGETLRSGLGRFVGKQISSRQLVVYEYRPLWPALILAGLGIVTGVLVIGATGADLLDWLFPGWLLAAIPAVVVLIWSLRQLVSSRLSYHREQEWASAEYAASKLEVLGEARAAEVLDELRAAAHQAEEARRAQALEAKKRKEGDSLHREIQSSLDRIDVGTREQKSRQVPSGTKRKKTDAKQGKLKARKGKLRPEGAKTKRGQSGKRRTKARVEPSGSVWIVRTSRPVKKFATQKQALEAAEGYLLKRGGGELLSLSRGSEPDLVRIAIFRKGQPSFQRLLEQVDLKELHE
jgi:hypothetical protein